MARTLLAAAVAAPWVTWALVRGSGLELPYPVAPALAFTPYAAATVGAGWITTWPAGRRLPPEITIDHVLAGPGVRVLGFGVHPVPGTDHRAVIAKLALG